MEEDEEMEVEVVGWKGVEGAGKDIVRVSGPVQGVDVADFVGFVGFVMGLSLGGSKGGRPTNNYAQNRQRVVLFSVLAHICIAIVILTNFQR